MPTNQNEKEFEEDIKAVSKGLVSHMYLYLQTMNIMESLNTESITDVHEKILQIAGLAGVDLSKELNDTKKMERLRDAAVENMVKEGLIERQPNGDYRIVESRRQEYMDYIYQASYNRKVAESARNMAKMVCDCGIGGIKLALKNQAVRQVDQIFGKIADKIAGAITRSQTQDSAADKASQTQEQAQTNAQTNSQEKESDFGEKSMDAAGKVAGSAIEKVFAYKIALLEAVEYADKQVRGDRAPKIKREDISPGMKEKTRGFKTAGIVSIGNCILAIAGAYVNLARKDMIYVVEEKIRERKGLIGFVAKKVPPAERLMKTVLTGADEKLEKAYQKHLQGKDSMNDIENKILDYNKRNYESSGRAKNFAQCLSELNLFRCGTSEYIPGWCKAMHLTKMDTVHALAYLQSHMEPTIDGVKLNPKAIGDDSRVIRQFEALKNNPKRFDAALKKLEADVVAKHKSMVEKVAEMREKAQLLPLSKKTTFHPDFANPTAPAQPFTYDEIGYSKWKSTTYDVKKALEDHIAMIVHYKDTVVGMFRGEEIGVIAGLDKTGYAKDMDKFDTFNLQHDNDAKDVCETGFAQAEKEMNIREVLRDEKNEDRRKNLFPLLEKLKDAGYDIMRTQTGSYEFRSRDTATPDFCIGKNSPVKREELPIEIRNFVADMKVDIMRQIHEKLGVSEELASDLKQELMQADRMPLGDKIRDPYLTAAMQLDQMESKIRQCNAWDALDVQKREEVITSIIKETEQSGFQAPGKEMCQIYESRMEEYQILKKSDPELAAYKLVDPSFEREGDTICGQADGMGFTIQDGEIRSERLITDPDLANIAFGLQEIANHFHEELDLQLHDQEQDMERE